MLIGMIETIKTNRVNMICGKYMYPKVIGTFFWYCTYDSGKLHKKKLNNVLYFNE